MSFLHCLRLLACSLLLAIQTTQLTAASPSANQPRAYPDGELRGICISLPDSRDHQNGLRQINADLDTIKAAGFNSLLLLVHSRYFAALDDVELQKAEPRAAWDALGAMIRAAKDRHIQVHLWYSPWIYKDQSQAIELSRHPEWAAVSAKGEADSEGICFVRPEVRQFELDLIAKAIDRYPDLAGIHIEEPGYNWGKDYCYCDHCRRHCQQNFALDIRQDPQKAKPIVHNLAAFMCTDFFIRLRAMMKAKRPDMWLSANGGPGDDSEWYIGRDWHTWARRGLIGFYMPQIYTGDLDQFTKAALATKACLGKCDMLPAIAVSWSEIHPRRQSPDLIKAEILAARKLGGKGFFIYYFPFLQPEHFQAIRAALQAPRPVSITP